MILPTRKHLLVQGKVPMINRDLSWLQFNDRVLAEARDPSNPLLKRFKFLAISASNLEEFFMIRLSGVLKKAGKDPFSRVTCHAILRKVALFKDKQARVFSSLLKELRPHHLIVSRRGSVSPEGMKVFEKEVIPYLIPRDQFGVIRMKEMRNLQSMVYFHANLWFEIPKELPTVFTLFEGEKTYLFFLDHLLLEFLAPRFGMANRPAIFRIVRDGDFSLDLSDKDPESIPSEVKKSVNQRDSGALVSLHYTGNVSQEFLQQISQTLGVPLSQCFASRVSLHLSGAFSAINKLPDRVAYQPGFNYPKLKPHLMKQFLHSKNGSIFDNLKERDVLLHHPYDSFEAFLLWIREACNDPNVIEIQQTIYRIDSSSPELELLKSVAKKKKIRIMFELRARFDEMNNLLLSQELKNAGVEVAFGFADLKLHAKVTTILRKEGDKKAIYTHLSTGNYNAKTAQQYTDLALFTANPELGKDAYEFFSAVWKGKIPTGLKKLATAPIELQKVIRELIRKETRAAEQGMPAYIFVKVNALVDEGVVADLYKASQAGVKIDLFVRGACSLIPNVTGLSKNIRVISIVDRFLEHSRIYYFRSSRKIFFSSADWMPRNFFSRLEIAFPIEDPKLYEFVSKTLIPAYLRDRVKARILTAEGTWERRPGRDIASSYYRAQFFFDDLADKHYLGTPLEHRRASVTKEVNKAALVKVTK